MVYNEWLNEQTPDRQMASLDHMVDCFRLGQVRHNAPFSQEAMELSEKVAAYYREYSN